VDGQEIEVSGSFTDLHTRSYEEILAGRGYRLAEVRPSIQLAADIRNTPVTADTGDCHPYLKRR
jgi:UDP-N-acetyl-2-amino-2-deoxyglucuronate dehydrogenase